tara:strand:+ start:1206 stop:3440 length:2235 start_codon:yes stop_codon:yes gene_type:complete
MSKTTFEGYVPSLKARHEATIVGGKAIQSKGGSIRYMLEGEYDGRKTLPKTVSKADFESVYGFDAKEAEAVIIVGSKDGKTTNKAHSIGAKDKDDFIPEVIVPMEQKIGDTELIDYAFENHAEAVIMTGELKGKEGKVNRFDQVGEIDEHGFTPETIVPVEKDEGIMEALLENAVTPDGTKLKSLRTDTVGSPSPADVQPPAPSEKPFPQEPSNENFSADNEAYEVELREEYDKYDAAYIMDMIKELVIRDRSEKEWLESYGYEDWSEVNLSKEDATNAIVALHLRNTEVKEAFGFGKDEEEEEEEVEEPKTKEFTVVLQEGDKLELTDIPDEEEPEQEDDSPVDDEPKEENKDETDENEEDVKESDVLAKVTRPIQEEEEKLEDDEEGSVDLGTVAKVGAIGLTAVALGNVLLAEDEEPFAFNADTDYTDIYGGRAEGSGQIDHDRIDTYENTEVHFRHDYPTTQYEWKTAKDPLTDEEADMVEDAVIEDIGDEPSEGDDSWFVDVDGVGEVGYWKDTDYGEKRFYGLAAEGEDFQKMTPSEFVPFDQMQEELGQMWDETTAPLADAHNYDYEPSNEPSNANFSADFEARTTRKSIYNPITDESQYDNPTGKMITTPDGQGHSGHHDRHRRNRKGHKRISNPKKMDYDNVDLAQNFIKSKEYEKQDLRDWKKHGMADTVGSPSPSGPSSIPEPAEATGSEPSNENMVKAADTKLAIGLTFAGVGLAVLLGKDKLSKWMDRFNL